MTHHDPARASSGYTLYTSTHAPEAILIDMGGQVVHRWHVPFSKVLKKTGETDRATEPDEEVAAREARLLADGDLLVVYDRPHHTPYGRGLARFDSDGQVVWGLVEHLHHDVTVAPNGRLYALAHEIRAEPRERLARRRGTVLRRVPGSRLGRRYDPGSDLDLRGVRQIAVSLRDHPAGGSRQPVWRRICTRMRSKS